MATIIEFSHRLTSGLSLVVTVALYVLSRKQAQRARFWAKLGLLFIFLEAAIGAGLVKFGLVAKDDSAMRAVVICLHLINTLGLLASTTMAWRASLNDPPLAPTPWDRLALAVILVTCGTGAITALGDTLFLGGAVSADHFLVQLRVIHPMIAVASAALVIAMARKRGNVALQLAVFAQVLLGALNIVLRAPGVMQVIHLAAANSVWILAIVAISAPSEAYRKVHEGHPA